VSLTALTEYSHSDEAIPPEWNFILLMQETIILQVNMITCKAFNDGLNCHQINLQLNSAWIFTVRVMPDGPYAPHEGYLSLLGTVITELHTILAKFFEPFIVYIIWFIAEIPLRQS
jgi:hypothetical protein